MWKYQFAFSIRRSLVHGKSMPVSGEEKILQIAYAYEQATDWVRRTMHIYRGAVLTRGHFARTHPYRHRFIIAYLEFKRWLRTGSTARSA